MSARYEALCLAGFLAFATSLQLIAVAAVGIWDRWLIAPFATMGLVGFWLWMDWLLRKARAVNTGS